MKEAVDTPAMKAESQGLQVQQQQYRGIVEPEISVMRVNQLDAGVLDGELHGLLRTQLGRVCVGLPAGTLERFKPEVNLQTSDKRKDGYHLKS